MPPAKAKYNPSVRGRRLARALRDARESAAMTVTEVAAHLGCTPGKISHIENRRNKPKVADVELMIELYGVASPERERLLALAREVGRHGWWTEYIDVFAGAYVALEDEAAVIWDWAPQVIPGLLQTQDYARELMRVNGVPDIERRLRARLARKTILTRDHPPELHVVLDESVLRRQVGDAETWRSQMYSLRADAARPNVTIQVLPVSIGAHVGMDGPFIVLKFDEEADPAYAYVEGMHGAVYLESPQQVANCNVAFERLCRAALDPQESAALIGAVANSKVPSNGPTA